MEENWMHKQSTENAEQYRHHGCDEQQRVACRKGVSGNTQMLPDLQSAQQQAG